MVVVPGLELTVENADPRRAGHAVAVGLREFVSVDAGARPQGDSARSLNIQDVPDSTIRPGMKMSFVERRIRRIVNARSVTLGLAVTFIGLALVGGVIIRFVDKENFPSVGLGIWWALQTVTTVGYGDVVPTSVAGRTIGGLEMVIGIAFISFVTAGVTSALVQRANQAAQEADIAKQEEAEQRILDELGRTNQALADLGRRLETIDSKLAG
jgi:hypothetical protein